MSKVSYFQRYSGRENHVTNNTLLVLRHVYQASPAKLEEVLADLLEEPPGIGLTFEQQVAGEHSVPDAVIQQAPLHIYVETKLGSGLWHDQIRRHVASIAAAHPEKAARKILIGLTRGRLADDEVRALRDGAKAAGVAFKAVAFSDLVDALERVSPEYEPGLRATVDDYRDFVAGEKLLDDERWLAAFPCGTSYDENQRYGVYYEPPSRPSKHMLRFIGIYRQKVVSLLGELATVAVCAYDGETVRVEKVERGTLTDEQRQRVRRVCEETSYYDLKAETLRFYLCDRMHPTALRKRSPGGILQVRYLNLVPWLGSVQAADTLPADEVAARLRDQMFD